MTRKGLLEPSKLGHILTENPELREYKIEQGRFIKYKERSYTWVDITEDRDYKESELYAKEQAKIQTVPVQEKIALTIKEAAEYSNIGINKLESLLRSPRCLFVLYVGKKKLVKRKEFEKYISDNIEI